MLPNLFSPSPIVWAGLLGLMVALPVAIHLINLLRHKRVKWAAMEFLLQSQRRRRSRVKLMQLLLLLARIAALITALAMLGQVGCRDPRLAGLLGGQTLHHYVLVDDSYSMGAMQAGRSAFDRAREALGTLGESFSASGEARVTLVRYSQALGRERLTEADLSLEQLTDLNGARVDSRFKELWEERRQALELTAGSMGPVDALSLVRQLIEQRTEEKAVVHLLSDFRAREWGAASAVEATPSPEKIVADASASTALTAEIRALTAAEVDVELIRCAETPAPNLGIRSLGVAGNIRAAGVPVSIRIEVENHSAEPASNVTVRVLSRSYDIDAASRGESTVARQAAELPTVFIDSIEPGKTAIREFPAFFPLPGRHEIRCVLPDDALADDNARYLVLPLEQASQALLVEGSAGAGARFLETLFQPGRAKSGVVTTVRDVGGLRELSQNDLNAFDTIYLLDVGTVDASLVTRLEDFVRQGGGLAMFVGESFDAAFHARSWYRAGEGLAPVPLDRIETLGGAVEGEVPDVVPTEHPLLAPFRDRNDAFLRLVQIAKHAVPPLDWDPAADPQLEVAALVRGDPRKPLIVEKPFGEGRTILVTTGAGPASNNWQRNPAFLVTMLGIQERLAKGRFVDVERTVGSPIAVELPAERYRATVQFETPTSDPEAPQTFERTATRQNETLPWFSGIGPGFAGAEGWNETSLPGLYTAWVQRIEGELEALRWALNVDPAEGALAVTSERDLASRGDSERVSVIGWDRLAANPQAAAGASLGRWLLPWMIALLVGEQWLAYVVSFHPGRGGNRP